MAADPGPVGGLAAERLLGQAALDPAAHHCFVRDVGVAKLALEIGLLAADGGRIDDHENQRHQEEDPSVRPSDADADLEQSHT